MQHELNRRVFTTGRSCDVMTSGYDVTKTADHAQQRCLLCTVAEAISQKPLTPNYLAIKAY